jgi:hypothetical protein
MTDSRVSREAEGRARCNGCNADYDLKWAGTTCIECDGDILAPQEPDDNMPKVSDFLP